MPLRCLDNGVSIHAFDLGSEEWAALAETNRTRRHLVMPCCSAPVTLKKSRLGTQFFAHKAVGECTTAPETEEHLKLKQIAVEVARAHGWEAQTEVAEGQLWRADVLATKGGAKVAIEIQWSPQTDEETLRRQRRYAESGVRGLWLLRQRKFAIDAELPAARVEAGDDGFLAHLPGRDHTLGLHDFLGAAFTRRLHFGVPANLPAKATINVGTLSCWACGADTDIVSSIAIAYGHEYRFGVPGLGEHPDLFALVRKHLPADAGVGIIRPRQSRTQARAYLSNGCAHCDALIGELHEHEAWENERCMSSFTFIVDERWRQVLLTQSLEAWGVYDHPPAT
jgi:Competence protein CoiA-like family